MKANAYLDDELWTRFRKNVLGKHGALRKPGDEVERLVRASVFECGVQRAF